MSTASALKSPEPKANTAKITIKDGLFRTFFDRINHGKDPVLQTAHMLESGQLRRTRLRALDRLGDNPEALKLVATTSPHSDLVKAAIERITDEYKLLEIAEIPEKATLAANRLASMINGIRALDDKCLIVIAIHADNTDVKVTALERLETRKLKFAVAEVAAKTKDKRVAGIAVMLLGSNEERLISVLEKRSCVVATDAADQLAKIATTQSGFLNVARFASTPETRMEAARRITHDRYLMSLAEEDSADQSIKVLCAEKLSKLDHPNQEARSIIAMYAPSPEARWKYFFNEGSEHARRIACGTLYEDTALKALAYISDDSNLALIAKRSSFRSVRLRAVGKIEDKAFLMGVKAEALENDAREAATLRLRELNKPQPTDFERSLVDVLNKKSD